MKALAEFLLLLSICVGGLALPMASQAQPCLPAYPTESDSPADWVQPVWNVGWIGSPLRGGVTKNGGWIRYYCAEIGTGLLVKVIRVSTVDDLANAGGRIRTIIRASDPLKSMQTAPARINMLPLTDPSLSAIVGDIR